MNEQIFGFKNSNNEEIPSLEEIFGFKNFNDEEISSLLKNLRDRDENVRNRAVLDLYSLGDSTFELFES